MATGIPEIPGAALGAAGGAGAGLAGVAKEAGSKLWPWAKKAGKFGLAALALHFVFTQVVSVFGLGSEDEKLKAAKDLEALMAEATILAEIEGTKAPAGYAEVLQDFKRIMAEGNFPIGIGGGSFGALNKTEDGGDDMSFLANLLSHQGGKSISRDRIQASVSQPETDLGPVLSPHSGWARQQLSKDPMVSGTF